MPKRASTVFLIVMLCWALLSGCAVSPEVEKTSLSGPAKQLKNTLVVFRNFDVPPNTFNGRYALAKCKITALEYLQDMVVFKDVLEKDDSEHEGLAVFVDAKITSMRIVMRGNRFGSKVLVNRSHMKLLVTLTDQSGAQIARKELLGSPSAFRPSNSRRQSDQILPENMGYLLGDFVLQEASWMYKDNS
ncbi:MAG: hypothetical protein GY874_20440 [Desulfobacteraceae bacterium]|nr:hypothetical protein [Desulfobacteraceae bacterium]